jgi:hypothetical protein
LESLAAIVVVVLRAGHVIWRVIISLLQLLDVYEYFENHNRMSGLGL